MKKYKLYADAQDLSYNAESVSKNKKDVVYGFIKEGEIIELIEFIEHKRFYAVMKNEKIYYLDTIEEVTELKGEKC